MPGGDKQYPVTSDRRDAGGNPDAFPQMKVDVHHPDVLRWKCARKSTCSPRRSGAGRHAHWNQRQACCCFPGIDSPVAGYMIAKRGVKIDAVYFHAPPYTSERAKQKVVDLAIWLRATLAQSCSRGEFTDIQLYIYDKCPHEELTIIMRRYMMRIAQTIAEQNGPSPDYGRKHRPGGLPDASVPGSHQRGVHHACIPSGDWI